MRTSLRSTLIRFQIPILIFAAVLCSVPAAEASVPIIVAVDTSRSLSTRELAATTDRVGEVLAAAPADSRFGLLAFDDSPRWIVEPPATAQAVTTALAELVPAGNFTLLNDALFTAARNLREGGVILLLTDGRDENSATTVEDVAEICRTNHVRIVSLSTGRRVDEKALRRLALLTDGAAPGRADRIDPTEIAGILETAAAASATEIEAARAAEKPPAPATMRETAPVPVQPVPVETPATPWWLLPLLILLFLGVLTMLFMLWRRPTARSVPPDAHPSGDWETDPMMTPSGESGAAKDPTLDLGPAPPMDDRADELLLDPSAFERLPFDGDIDATTVLDEQHILSVMEPGKEIRSFRLRPDRAFAVGRAPGVNTLVLDSRALSAQHFKIVPHEGGFAVVDLDSTNGTLVNGRKIRAHHLEAGDSIRAGEVQFEFKVMLKSLN